MMLRLMVLFALAGQPASAASISVSNAPLVAPEFPSVIDGHADFAIHYLRRSWSVEAYDFEHEFPGQAGVSRWKTGGIDGALVTVASDQEPGSGDHFPRVLASLDWFDALVARYPNSLVAARTPSDFEAAHRAGKIALMPAIEGGEQLDGSLKNLSTAYRRGVRSILIVYDHHNDIGDGAMAMGQSAAIAAPAHGGLSRFGRKVIDEMNKLGIAIDLSHAAQSTALETIAESRAPAIFTHSAARALADTPRNLSDRVLNEVAARGGLVMIPFVPYLTTTEHWHWWSAGEARFAELTRLYPEDQARVSNAMSEWDASNPQPKVGVGDVANQIEYVAKIVGKDKVGIGSDFDGMDQFAVAGLQDAAQLPKLLRELSKRGWTRSELEALARGNFLRVMADIQGAAQR